MVTFAKKSYKCIILKLSKKKDSHRRKECKKTISVSLWGTQNNNTMKNLKSRNEMKKDKTYWSMKKTNVLPSTLPLQQNLKIYNNKILENLNSFKSKSKIKNLNQFS